MKAGADRFHCPFFILIQKNGIRSLPVQQMHGTDAAPAGAEKVTSPMPGTVLAVKVAVGQSVKKGETVVLLEAMKMENEIPAPRDGVVASISVNKGSSVQAGDLLISLN